MRSVEGRAARGLRAWALLLCVALLAPLTLSSRALAVHQLPAAAKRQSSFLAPLQLGFGGDPLLTTGGVGSRLHWIRRSLNVGADIVRVNVQWSQVAPVRPVHPANPRSIGYDWAGVDTAVRALSAHGLSVMLMLYDAPRWAEGRHLPRAETAGSWRPNPRAFAQFATAAARRYDGRFRDPLHRRAHLPRVRYWQAWNEPNVDQYFSPQRVKTGHGWQTVSPDAYRKLLTGFYAAVKRVSRSNYVVSGGTSSYGNGPGKPLGKEATAPVVFYRMLFCLHGSRSADAARGCPPVRLDAVDHHPYNALGPYHHGKYRNWVSIPDVHRIASLVKVAGRAGTLLPSGPKALWVTELGWSSNPPNPRGVPMAIDARWYEQSLYSLWNQGVSVIMALLIGDPPAIAGNTIVLDGGLYYSDGKPKPIATAYRFPFVVTKLGAGRLRAWGRSPRTGRLVIEVERGSGWHVVRALEVHRWQVFETSVTGPRTATWRARIGSDTSLTWRPGAYTRR